MALILVAPAGFSEGDRKAWLTAAGMTLTGIPVDLLERGLTAARRVADHPSKIIPAIMEEVGESWKWRKENRPTQGGMLRIAPQPPQAAEPCTPEQADEIMREFGLKANPVTDPDQFVQTTPQGGA